VEFTNNTNPLVKFHGCLQRARDATLWTQGQVSERDIQARVKSCSEWMNLHLPGKHLIVIGFWTDWGYLNDVIGNSLTITNASSVTVIDPSTTMELQTKAPNLWKKLNGLSSLFEHVQASGADALEELRTAFSKVWARKFQAFGRPLVEAAGFSVAPPGLFDTLAGDELYNLRRDAEGVSYMHAATLRGPLANVAQTAFVYAIFLNAGATMQGAWLRYSGRLIRVVNGAGQGLADVEARYKEPPTVLQSEIVVCAGAIELGVPAKLIASGRGASTIRPAPGGGARWLTLETARAEFGL
jgi:hypothetical protein